MSQRETENKGKCTSVQYWPPACHFLRTIFNLHHVSALFLLHPSTLSYSCKNRPGVWPFSFRFWFSFSVIDLQGLTEAAVCKIYFWSFLIVWPWFGQRCVHWTQLCTFFSHAIVLLSAWRKTEISETVCYIMLQHHYFKSLFQLFQRIKSNNNETSHASLAQITHTKKIFLDCTTNAHATVFVLYAVGP